MRYPYVHTGNVWFVRSTGSSAADDTMHGKSASKPFATLAYAVTQATANNGDVIFVLPGHTENISDTVTGLSVSVAGLKIIGLGNGSDRPTFSITDPAAWFGTSADGILIENLHFVAAAADVSYGVLIDGTNNIIRRCVFTEGTNLNFLISIRTSSSANAGDGVIVEDCFFVCPDDANTDGIAIGHTDDVIIRRNLMMGDWSTAAIGKDLAVSGSTPISVLDNVIYNEDAANDSCIFLHFNNTTGLVARNLVSSAALQSNQISGGVFGLCENYASVNSEDLSGILEPIET